MNKFWTVIALLVFNVLLLLYEKGQASVFNWKIYYAMSALALIAAAFPLIGFILLVPITVYNLMNNTSKFISKTKEGGLFK